MKTTIYLIHEDGNRYGPYEADQFDVTGERPIATTVAEQDREEWMGWVASLQKSMLKRGEKLPRNGSFFAGEKMKGCADEFIVEADGRTMPGRYYFAGVKHGCLVARLY